MKPAQRTIDSSPRSTGPAGGQFEAKVGTHYALALLASTEPFGLPGAMIDRLEFQRGGPDHPLDDVIVRGTTPEGEDRCLEVQAKRSMAFTESDANFASIVDGIVRARKIDPDRRFAVAIERTTGAIDNGVQEVLELAQQTVDVASFLKLIGTPGRSNKDMRAFVAAFRVHLETSGETGDDALYETLRSFSVLTFDYARPNSIAEQHDRFRARQLTSTDSGPDPYDGLFGLVVRADAMGGELDRSELVRKLNAVGISIGSAPTLAAARRHIEELSRHALEDIGLTVNECRLARENLLKLRLLVRTRLNTDEAISEVELANDWLASGAGASERTSGETRSRKRVIYAVGKGLIESAGLVDVAGQDAQAVAGLIADGVLVEIQSDRVRFRHDLFTDWAVACALSDDSDVMDGLPFDAPPPFWMTRGFELACRMLAESGSDEA